MTTASVLWSFSKFHQKYLIFLLISEFLMPIVKLIRILTFHFFFFVCLFLTLLLISVPPFCTPTATTHSLWVFLYIFTFFFFFYLLPYPNAQLGWLLSHMTRPHVPCLPLRLRAKCEDRCFEAPCPRILARRQNPKNWNLKCIFKSCGRVPTPHE